MRILFLVLLILAALAALSLIIIFPLKLRKDKTAHRELVGRKLYRLAVKKDYYLLNNLVIKVDDEVTLHIDHLLCADKYIYVVADRFYPLGISGRPEDNTWFSYTGANKKTAIKNIVSINEERTIRLAKFLGWNESKSPMLISVVCINDELALSSELAKFDRPYSFLVKKKNVVKRIAAAESGAKVSPLDAENLAKLVQTIHEISLQTSEPEKNDI